ncbi:MAG: hypothetical protein ACTSPV_19955 [Candidatus Hodarchaeales archaeon]
MKGKENWALFVEGVEVKWTFGNPSEEFQHIVVGFLKGLGELGKEMFGEGIASITFELKKYSQPKLSEIFIISLHDQFYFIICDPPNTILLLSSGLEGGVPWDIKEVMQAVLVGQASILYATSTEDLDEDEKTKIEHHYQNIILDINEEYKLEDKVESVVGKSGSNFGLLSFEELVLFHFYLRKQAEKSLAPPKQSWCLISNMHGGELPFVYNIEEDLLYSGYFSAIIGFISSLFKSKPKILTFGSTYIQKVRFVYGKRYFMAIDTSFMIDMLLNRRFQKQFFEMPYSIIKDMSSGLKELIVEEINEYNRIKLEELSAEDLLDSYVDEGIEDFELFIGDEDENLTLIREERMNQVLRVWGT